MRSVTHQEMRLVQVDRAGELGLLTHHLAKDHDLLKEEDGEGLHFAAAAGHGGGTAAAASSAAATAAPRAAGRAGEVVQAHEGTAVEQLSLGSDLALQK